MLEVRGWKEIVLRGHAIKPCPLNYYIGDPKGTRTPVTGVRGQRPRPLDDRALLCASNMILHSA